MKTCWITIAMTALMMTAPTLRGAADSVTRPATDTAPATDPRATELLNELEKAQPESIRAEVDYHVVLGGGLGDSEDRTGWVAYRAAKNAEKGEPARPPKFRVHFDTLKQGGGRAIRAVVDYAFDGKWFYVKKHRVKQLQKFQVAAEGETVEPMRLGKGPFPLPFGQKTDAVLEYFEATAPDEPGRKAPENTDLLILRTRDDKLRETEFREIRLWIDRDRRLPVRIYSRDRKRNRTTVDFKKIRTDVDFEEEMFELPSPPGWHVEIRPLDG